MVGRVLNLVTGHVSDQYHCLYDDHYSTVSAPEGAPNDNDTFDPLRWQCLLKSGYKRHAEIEMDKQGNPIPLPPLDDEWLSGPKRALQSCIHCKCREAWATQFPREPIPRQVEREIEAPCADPAGFQLPKIPGDPDADCVPNRATQTSWS
jgi:hypothetical protein